MTMLYGQNLSRREIAARSGTPTAFGGVRLVTLGDGAGRGMRMLEFRTTAGLRFTVAVDRAMDIVELEHMGRPIGWQSPTGPRHPAYFDYEGEGGLGPLRSFNGFLVTCGLDHIGGPETVDGSGYNYPRRDRVPHGLHGRINATPARLTGHGEHWEGERCILWAEGVAAQATGFGENLHLHRRIEVDLDGSEIRLSDRVVNAGFVCTPHMFFYHVNLGHPVLDEGARYLAPIRDVLWASHADAYRAQGVGYRSMTAPREGFREQVWAHDMAADAAGRVSVALVNDRIGLGLEVETQKAELPCAYQWQNLQAGSYALGIEPATHHVLGDNAARDRDEMIWLGAQEERRYHATFRVLDGPGAIGAAEARITAAARQPDDDFPEPSGHFPRLRR
ncbi:MAG: aldose 1-epimerase family protein [Rubellimicrobium sp.]|nr:aldose 1-epimerase family protein [Rubellimicrobium sp.]